MQQEEEFFDLDKSKFGLKPVRCEVWEGFIFVNFDDKAEPLADTSGPWAKGLEGYPFHEMSEVYSYKAEINSNWKLFIDAFAEFYHAPVLHVNQATREGREAAGLRVRGAALRAARPAFDDLVVGWDEPAQGHQHGQAHRAEAAQRPVRAVGPPRHRRAGPLPPGREPGGARSSGVWTPTSSSPTSCC